MGRGVSSWLAGGRSLQLLGSLAASAVHGYLMVEVHRARVEISKGMVMLQLLACLLLVYSSLAIIVQYLGQRAKKQSWLTAFVVCDVVAFAALIVIINMLAFAGLPLNCEGLLEQDYPPYDNTRYPMKGFTTISFSDERFNNRGELDGLCGLGRSYFAIAHALILVYMSTITLTVLRIFQQKYTKNTKVSEMLDSLERAEDISLKVLDSPSPVDESPRMSVAPPPSEGIITRNTSLRSNFTTATSVAGSHHTNPYAPSPASRRAMPTIPRRPLPPTSPTSNNPNHDQRPAPNEGFVPVPLDEDEDAAEAALVSDGMQHRPHRSHQHQNQPPHHHSHGGPSHSHGHSHNHSYSRMTLPMLSEEDHHSHPHAQQTPSNIDADAALVSDGMRPSEPMLPPYHPGNRRMSGHGEEEDNEMRLSGYVKGQTRAQEMKDSGRY